MKSKYPVRAVNETGDKTIDVQVLVVPDSAITAGSGAVNLATATGDVTGPSSSTDNAIARFDSTTGKVIQNSTITVSDTGTVAAASGTLTLTSPTLSGSTTISNSNGAGYESTISGSVSSPYDILTILSKGGTGGWLGAMNFDLSYNAGAAFTGLAIRANADGLTANYSFGGLANRSSGNGYNIINIFNGTAPTGTLTNGASFYVTGGEMRVMDAAGNSTLLSPHDTDTNDHIYFSKNTKTGKVLVVETERMWRALNEMLGGGYIHEFDEEPDSPHLPRKDYDKNWQKKTKEKI